MDAIKYLESRLPPGIRGNTLVDGDTLAIAIGEFDAAQKRADALAAENVRLREERRALHDALLTLVSHIHMRAHPSNRTKWVCPYCKGTHKSLTALEEGEGHTESCPYAAARRVLDGESTDGEGGA